MSLNDVKVAEYLGIFFAGGQGTMWDFSNSDRINTLTAAFYESGHPVWAVCHEPVALTEVKLSNGENLVKGKQIAAFTNAEEKAVGADTHMPFLLETRLTAKGVKVVSSGLFQEYAVRDDLLITGQNPALADKIAELFLKALKNEP